MCHKAGIKIFWKRAGFDSEEQRIKGIFYFNAYHRAIGSKMARTTSPGTIVADTVVLFFINFKI